MNKRYIQEIAEALSEKHAALMVGAGFSMNAAKTTVSDKRFLNWNELSDKFYEVVNKDDEPDKKYCSPLRLAQEVEVTVGRPTLDKIIKDAVPDSEYVPSDLYVQLMNLPWRDVFTTNYDTLLERAAEKVTKRRYNVVVCQEDLVNSNDAPRILKLHGSFPSQRPFIITEEDYRTYPVKFAAMVNTVQQALLENVFCMLGFSCDDPNFINWIGWIHDNLGKSSSQKIYMVSISHMSEAKSKLLFERNIVVIDLEELWPKKTIEERLYSFLGELKLIIENKEKKDNWFDLNQIISSLQKPGISEKTRIMKKLNDSYPGWIFLPWRIKTKVNNILKPLSFVDKFQDYSLEEQLDYMYEYVRLMDISGRPILSKNANLFFKVLTENNWDSIKEKSCSNLDYKIQVVYLQLLRTYRELAAWDKYEICHECINASYLDYEDKQFLYACDCWKALFKFEADDLAAKLEAWDMAEGDVYWPLMKASMYARLGEFSKAEELLNNNLTFVRKQLMNKNSNVYLSSLEESIVSLINFIRQGNDESEQESCINEDEIFWWNENEKYFLNLNAEKNERNNFQIKSNYDLSITQTVLYGNNQGVFQALEYLRFLEQTGHSFRLQNVTNTKGLDSTIEILSPYYPHWCIIQILISQSKNDIDFFFGRAQLSGYTKEEIDRETKEYIRMFQTVINNVKPQNYFFAKTIYDQSAIVLPDIISRFCYRCSVDLLDEILAVTLELCNSNVRANFRNLEKILKGALKSYTVKEQEERIDQILEFPVAMGAIYKYKDPVNYLKLPEQKYKLDLNAYNRTVFQIKRIVETGNEEEKEAAIYRLQILEQVIELQEEDKEYLCNELKKKNTLEDKWLLYNIDRQKYKNYVGDIFNDTITRMKNDTKSIGISTGGSNYSALITIIEDVNILEVDISGTFNIMKALVEKNSSLIAEKNFEAKERVRQSFIVAVGLIVLCEINNYSLRDEEKSVIRQYFSTLENVYGKSHVIQVLLTQFVDKSQFPPMEEIKKAIWLINTNEIELLRDIYDILSANKYNIKKDRTFSDFTGIVLEEMSYKLLNSDIQELDMVLDMIHSLLINEICTENPPYVLDASLSELINKTCIHKEDLEQVALNKLKCREKACLIAKELHLKGIKWETISEWNLITQDENEFIELRQIEFN